MMRLFGKIAWLALPLLIVLLGTTRILACSCETFGQPRRDAREYYTKKFGGAVFTGTIRAIKHDPAAASGGITTSSLTVEVDEYWLGVTEPLLTVLTYGPNTSCSINWKIGTKDFFIASKYDSRLYHADCDLANWGARYPSAKWADYTLKVLGRAKRFPKARIASGAGK